MCAHPAWAPAGDGRGHAVARPVRPGAGGRSCSPRKSRPQVIADSRGQHFPSRPSSRSHSGVAHGAGPPGCGARCRNAPGGHDRPRDGWAGQLYSAFYVTRPRASARKPERRPGVSFERVLSRALPRIVVGRNLSTISPRHDRRPGGAPADCLRGAWSRAAAGLGAWGVPVSGGRRHGSWSRQCGPYSIPTVHAIRDHGLVFELHALHQRVTHTSRTRSSSPAPGDSNAWGFELPAASAGRPGRSRSANSFRSFKPFTLRDAVGCRLFISRLLGHLPTTRALGSADDPRPPMRRS